MKKVVSCHGLVLASNEHGSGGLTSIFAIVPRYVLGGPGFVPPSEKVNVALIGAGGMGMRNAQALLNEPEARIAAVSARLTEVALLGNVALRVGKKILWKPSAMKATNAPEADAFIKEECRKGWEIG